MLGNGSRGRGSFVFTSAVLFALAGTPILAQDIGHVGPSYVGASSWPAGVKPQDKLWHLDGSWWGALWSTGAQSFTIHRLDLGLQQWVDTGVEIDRRPDTHTDCLLDGGRLYVVSHVFTEGSGVAGHKILFSRFTYKGENGSFAKDPGYPVQIGNASTEAATIARDSTGTLWATWTFGLRVHIAHSTVDDRTWTNPFVLPENTSDINSDDNCAILHFGGNKIGVMWSDENLGPYWFTTHADGNPDGQWSPKEEALSAAIFSDDQCHLKAASDGRVFAAAKAASNENRLLVRETNGTWNGYQIAKASDSWTRPTLVLDERARIVHVYATHPIQIGAIHEKTSSMDAIAFAPGLGTPVIRNASDPSLNDATSTKQSIDRNSGLVVLAAHQPTQHYGHHFDALGGPLPVPPSAAFSADPVAGFTPLTVHFSEFSSGAPTSWTWDFGDGEFSGQSDPAHAYAFPGTYTVSLHVGNAQGDDDLVATNLVTVQPAPTHLLLTALEDAHVSEAAPGTNFGELNFLRVRETVNGEYRSFLRFQVPSSGNRIVSALLRLFVEDASPDGGTVYSLSSPWNETTITWNNAPTLPGLGAVGSLGAVTAGTWAELDVTSVVTEGGIFDFGIATPSTNSAFYTSREGLNPPQLVLVLEEPPTGAPVVDFSGTPLTGFAPLTVSFTDLSTQSPSSWSWTFGDGQGSTQENPAHVFAAPGHYTVALQATNELDTGSLSRTAYVTVNAHPAPLPFLPTADSLVFEGSPTTNQGLSTTLRVKTQAGMSYQSFLRFDLTSLAAAPVSATLRLRCTDPSSGGGSLYALALGPWTETGVTWNDKPSLPASPLATLGSVELDTWVEINLGSAISGPGLYEFALAGGTTNSAFYSSREGANPPELVVVPGTPEPTADFSATPLSGSAPLSVTFTDLSADPASWLWTFGDGGTSTEQNPVHVYTTAGTYTVSLQVTNASGSDLRTQTNLISVGVNPCSGVACTPSDPCHPAGICDPETGFCSNPTAADGTECDDGSACTASDSCQAGVCTGSTAVTCAALDPCHVVGTCDPQTGVCSSPPADDGTACTDGNACTQADTCQGGVCDGANPVVCVASDQCHDAGVCQPANGQCTNPAKEDGTLCDDGNACTTGDACGGGACAGMGGTVTADVSSVLGSKADATATFAWDPTVDAMAYDMLRGEVRNLPVGSNPASETCFGDVLVTTASDGPVPAAGDGYWYLVRAKYACGNGGYGSQASHGVPTLPRLSGTCP